MPQVETVRRHRLCVVADLAQPDMSGAARGWFERSLEDRREHPEASGGCTEEESTWLYSHFVKSKFFVKPARKASWVPLTVRSSMLEGQHVQWSDVGSVMARSSEVAPRRLRANCRGSSGESCCPPFLLGIRSRPNYAKPSFAWQGHSSPVQAQRTSREPKKSSPLMYCCGRTPESPAVKPRAKGWRAS